MRKIILTSLLSFTCFLAFSQNQVRLGYGQEFGGWGAAYEYKFHKLSLGWGVGKFPDDKNLDLPISWEIFSIYYFRAEEDDFLSSPFVMVGYGTVGNHHSKVDNNEWELDYVVKGFYGLLGYQWWLGDRFSVYGGIGYSTWEDLPLTMTAGITFKI